MAEKKIVRSACRMCHGVCQVLVHMEGDRIVKITGDKDSPTSRGYICEKGRASAELLYHPDRILTPLRRSGKRGGNKWERISWDEAYDSLAENLNRIRRENGPEYFGMLQGTGRPYTGFTQRFCNAFGTPNMTGVAHICYIPRVLASMITTGHNIPVCDIYGFGGAYPECLILWGCNVTETGASDGMCGGMVQRAINRARHVIVIDPRRIRPAAKADHWLQIRPGTDGALALAFLNVIITENLFDKEFVTRYTKGFDRLVDHIRQYTPDWASEITRIPPETIRMVARLYAGASSSAIQWGNALDMSHCNFQTARSVLILSAISGHLDAPGGDVFWVPPEGVRLKSPFANPLFAGNLFLPLNKYRLGLDGTAFRPDRANWTLWIEDRMLGMADPIRRLFLSRIERLVADKPLGPAIELMNRLRRPRFPFTHIIHPPAFWRSIVSGNPYRLKGLWIMGSNPLITMTHSEDIEKSLKLLKYIVVSDFFMTPTAQYADLFLPSSTWLEREDVVNMHKNWCVTAQVPVTRVGDTKDDREVIIQVARRLGLTRAFPWDNYRRFLDWMLADAGMNFEQFSETGILTGDMRYWKYKDDGFPTPSGKFEIYSRMLKRQGVSPLPVYREPPHSPQASPEVASDYPFILIGGTKNRYFFHSEGRQIKSLRKRNPDPLLEIHPKTATKLDIADGDWVWVETPRGRIKMKALLTEKLAEDVVCAQYGWWFPETASPDYNWQRSNVNRLFGETQFDPDTGSECLKSALCKVYPASPDGSD